MPKMFDKPYIECVDYGKCVDYEAFFETHHNLRIMVFRFNWSRLNSFNDYS